jgi:hypothetical protein
MPVNVRVNHRRIELKITNARGEAQDERARGPRYDLLDRREGVTLIKQLAAAIERLDNE